MSPGFFDASAMKRSTRRASSSYGAELMTTNSTGRLRGDWPSEGGLVGKARTPGIWASFGASSCVISCCLRVRSSQGFRRRMARPSATVGKPASALKRCISGIVR